MKSQQTTTLIINLQIESERFAMLLFAYSNPGASQSLQRLTRIVECKLIF